MDIGFVDYSRTGIELYRQNDDERTNARVSTKLEVRFLSCHRVLVARIEFPSKRVNVRIHRTVEKMLKNM